MERWMSFEKQELTELRKCRNSRSSNFTNPSLRCLLGSANVGRLLTAACIPCCCWYPYPGTAGTIHTPAATMAATASPQNTEHPALSQWSATTTYIYYLTACCYILMHCLLACYTLIFLMCWSATTTLSYLTACCCSAAALQSAAVVLLDSNVNVNNYIWRALVNNNMVHTAPGNEIDS